MIWRVCGLTKSQNSLHFKNTNKYQSCKSTINSAKMCQKAKNNGQFVMNCPILSNHYKKDVFGSLAYGFEPFNLYCMLKDKL